VANNYASELVGKTDDWLTGYPAGMATETTEGKEAEEDEDEKVDDEIRMMATFLAELG
jgi:hypothetical protein